MKRIHLIISGKVQGINFRHYTRKKAVGLGLTGWVKNANDDVEVVAEGPEDKLKELIEFCRQRMAAYKYPRIVEIIPEIPKTATGKFLRRVLREQELKGNTATKE